MDPILAFLKNRPPLRTNGSDPAPQAVRSGKALLRLFLDRVDAYTTAAMLPFSERARELSLELPEAQGPELLETAEARGWGEGVLGNPQHRFLYRVRGTPADSDLLRESSPPSRIDALRMISLQEDPRAVQTLLHLAEQSMARFGFTATGALWLTDDTFGQWKWESMLNGAMETGFQPVGLSVQARRARVSGRPRGCANLASCEHPDYETRCSTREEWCAETGARLGALVEAWNAWQTAAEAGASMRRFTNTPLTESEFVSGPAKDVLRPYAPTEFTFPASGALPPAPYVGFVRDEPMDPARNPYAPLLAMADYGALPLGWTNGWAMLYTPVLHAMYQGRITC